MTAESEATQAPTPNRRGDWLRAIGWTLAAVYFLLAFAILTLKYWVLPDIGRHARAIEQAVSNVVGERVTIEHIAARWTGLHAELDLRDVRIHDAQDRVALQLPLVQAVIGWRSIPMGSIRLHSLALDTPELQVRRDSAGQLHVAGFALDRGGEGGSSTWIWSQPEIVVRNARLSWIDDLRAAPELVLSDVNLVLQNRFGTHRLALRAKTAPELASTLDVRARLSGDEGTDVRDWTGRVFAQLDYVDLAAWQRWVDYPIEMQSGRGAVRLWASVRERRMVDSTVDVALAGVKTRLGPELPLLELEELKGRLSSATPRSGTSELSGRAVTFRIAGGEAAPEADFDLRVAPPAGDRAESGELVASALSLEALAGIAEYLPFSTPLRKRIADAQPRGMLQDMKLSWSGSADAPQRFALRGRFSGLGARDAAASRAFAGMSGSIDATEAGGTARLESQGASLDLAGWLPEPAVRLDTLVAGLAWKRHGGRWEVGFSNVTVANRDAAATLHGTFVTPEAGREAGTLDLSASFTRADPRAVYRYIPHLPRGVADYLKAAIDAGSVPEATLRIKGALRDFPFADRKSGTFQVTARIANGEYEYADRWPRITGIAGDLQIDGPRLQLIASRAATLGARLANVRVVIADFLSADPVVRVEGTADAPVAEFLRFTDTTPVAEMIGHATHGMAATGPGRLQLALDLPLERLAQTRVAGAVQFSGGNFVFDPALPAVGNLSGRLEFSQDALTARALAGQFLGGPASFSIATRNDRGERLFVVTAQGSATIGALQRAFDLDWLLQRASGSTAWTGTATLGSGGRFDLVVESPLSGVAMALPAPLTKRVGEALAFRLERTTRPDAEWLRRARITLPAQGDAFSFSAGRLVNGVFLRRRGPDGYAIQRGAVGINEPAPPFDAAGIAVAANAPAVDVDAWRGVAPDRGVEVKPLDPAYAQQQAGNPISSVKLAVGTLDAGGKRFNDVRMRATPANGGWNASVQARELEGTIGWQDEGQGRITARLKHFQLPESADEGAAQQAAPSAGGDLPALDIVADDFVLGDKKLGRLEVVAINEARSWKIDRLLISNSDSALTATGVWQSRAARPSINLDLKLEVSDAGSFLSRVGFPGTMRGGLATLEGQVGWSGGPQALDYPTLGGNVRITASKGQFLRAEPGIAKLLGILSLQSWVTLDFREALGEGFRFDSLSSTAKISRGVLTTDDFNMVGKSARISMAGSVDLARETQDLHARIVPSVGDSASTVAGLLLANPVTALGAMVAQRLLKDPLGRIFAVEYTVTGSWTEPKVERVRTVTTQAETTPP